MFIKAPWPQRSKVKVISSHRLYISSLPLLNSGNKSCTCVIRGGRRYTMSAEPGGHTSCLTVQTWVRRRRPRQVEQLECHAADFHMDVAQRAVVWTRSRRAVCPRVSHTFMSPGVTINTNCMSPGITYLYVPRCHNHS